MPEKLQRIGKPNFSTLSPAQVRVSSVVEIGAKHLGRSGERIDLSLLGTACHSCESCQSCQSCQACQRVNAPLDEIGIENLTVGPVKIARDVIYELIQKADMEHGECKTTQSRVILEMPQEAYDQMPGKDRFVEIGTTETGTKQYLLRGSSPLRAK